MTVRDYLVFKAKSYKEMEINQAALKSKTDVPSNRAIFERDEDKFLVCAHIYISLLGLLPVEALDMELYSEVRTDAE